MALGHLASAQQIFDFALAGPALRQPGEPRPGRAEPPRGQLSPGLLQLGLKSSRLHRDNHEPCRQHGPEPDENDQQATTHRRLDSRQAIRR